MTDLQRLSRNGDLCNTGRMNTGHSFADLCRALGKDTVYVRNLQRGLKLYVPPPDEGYPECYLRFLDKIVALKTFSVPRQRIADLLDTEIKIMRLLHVDAIDHSPTWYMDGCPNRGKAGQCLLLSGYDLGFPVTSYDTGELQQHLDFRGKDPELFAGHEMGEDIRAILKSYAGQVTSIAQIVDKERAVLENALDWVSHVTWRM